ncbi:unnamed protein product [Somion occarium]|uniref:Elongator complex protein 4 n=1 Tax=Somion occarium TaxID=3059160 RepID=A0ABP1CL31_9APHY
MSSFKRKTTSNQISNPIGTRVIPGPVSTFITSTGVPSLDDILGGGLPLTCSLLILAPDVHTAYGELIQKYFIAQGLACGQTVCVLDDNAKEFVSECMWIPSHATQTTGTTAPEDEEDETAKSHDAKIKIAWRYEQMKQFQTTVSSTSQSSDDFCKVFDLTCRIPSHVLQSGQLLSLNITTHTNESSTRRILKSMKDILESEEVNSYKPIRICIPALGCPQWGDIEPEDLCYFLQTLLSMIRNYPQTCLSLSLAPHLCTDSWGGPGWTQKLGWLSDACVSLSAFTANPALSAMFPSHHGFVQIHSLPAPYTLLPPSDKFSTLRGLSSSGENNLAFKCMRKRLIFETLHLDLEGGVGERRTTPSATTMAMESETHAHHHPHTPGAVGPSGSEGSAKVEVQLEDVRENVAKVMIQEASVSQATSSSAFKKAKPKKRVAFKSDRPDLYDF